MTDAPFTCCETICLRDEGSEVEDLSSLTVSVAASKKKIKVRHSSSIKKKKLAGGRGGSEVEGTLHADD